MDMNLAEKPAWRERLAAALEETKRSKREVSLTAGLGPNYVHEILSSGKEPTLKKLMAVASALDISVSYLLGETKQ